MNCCAPNHHYIRPSANRAISIGLLTFIQLQNRFLKMVEIKSLLVYCGANEGFHPMHGEAAKKLGRILAREKIKLIYGGGSIGLMGMLADEVLNNGGEVEGVIPDFLNEKEIGHK